MKERIFYVIIYLFSLLPFWVMYRISDFLYVVLYYLIGYRKKVVFANLRNSFPEKSEEEIKKIAKKFYRYLPDIIVESIKLCSISKNQVLNRMELIDPDELFKHLDNGIFALGVTAHYANWELGIHRLSLMMGDKYPTLIVYKPLNNAVFNSIYNKIRSRFGAKMIQMKQILRHIVRMKDVPHISIFVADQTPTYQDSDYFMNFLNQDTLVYTGVERISKMTNHPVVYCFIGRKKRRGRYFCRFTTIVDNPQDYSPKEITHLHNRFTEKLIREKPEYWLWSHRRWKRKRRK